MNLIYSVRSEGKSKYMSGCRYIHTILQFHEMFTVYRWMLTVQTVCLVASANTRAVLINNTSPQMQLRTSLPPKVAATAYALPPRLELCWCGSFILIFLKVISPVVILAYEKSTIPYNHRDSYADGLVKIIIFLNV